MSPANDPLPRSAIPPDATLTAENGRSRRKVSAGVRELHRRVLLVEQKEPGQVRDLSRVVFAERWGDDQLSGGPAIGRQRESDLASRGEHVHHLAVDLGQELCSDVIADQVLDLDRLRIGDPFIPAGKGQEPHGWHDQGTEEAAQGRISSLPSVLDPHHV